MPNIKKPNNLNKDKKGIIAKNKSYLIYAMASLLLLLLVVMCVVKDPKSKQVATPVFSPADSIHYEYQNVSISCATPSAIIRYTTDNSTPTSSSILYDGVIPVSTNTTLKAKAFKKRWMESETASANYRLKIATPTFSPAGGFHTTLQNVTISCSTDDVIIRYTTDGITPDSSSSPYSGAISIGTNTTLKAKAFRKGWVESDVADASYIYPTQIVYVPPIKMVYVPGGTFTMGRTKGDVPLFAKGEGGDHELPTHNVTLRSFYIGKYQVTQSEYQAIVGFNPASFVFGAGDNYPVYDVGWYDAIKYCNLRSMIEGLTPVYSVNGSTDPATWGTVPDESNYAWDTAICNWNANGYRLPTEAEWEYAARGATNNPDYLYSGSDNIYKVAWFSGNSDGITHPVGIKAANGLGIHDMSGNVLEWCWDWYGKYSDSPQNNPTGPTIGSKRMTRGGFGYIGGDVYCRVVNRIPSSMDSSAIFIGFRVCRTAK